MDYPSKWWWSVRKGSVHDQCWVHVHYTFACGQQREWKRDIMITGPISLQQMHDPPQLLLCWHLLFMIYRTLTSLCTRGRVAIVTLTCLRLRSLLLLLIDSLLSYSPAPRLIKLSIHAGTWLRVNLCIAWVIGGRSGNSLSMDVSSTPTAPITMLIHTRLEFPQWK